MKSKYPMYIVSKGRASSRLTSKALENMGLMYFIIVEAQEYEEYAKVIDPHKVLILPPHYQRDYETCDDVGEEKSKGPGPARNFAWDHSMSLGHARHWVMDDNIASFQRLNRNLMVRCSTSVIFRCAEDFVDRYQNVYIAGFNYDFFVQSKEVHPPFIRNTRIYSCLLLQNDIPYRWRGRYNEDTDLSLRVLKDGHCTVQFNAFIQEKAQTQTLKGGNTEEFYAKEGTLPKSEMIAKLHPDCAKVVWKFNRWHHHVDYRRFKKNQFIKKEDVFIGEGVNNYGMKLIDPTVDKTINFELI
jgi:hypothetical protein